MPCDYFNKLENSLKELENFYKKKLEDQLNFIFEQSKAQVEYQIKNEFEFQNKRILQLLQKFKNPNVILDTFYLSNKSVEENILKKQYINLFEKTNEPLDKYPGIKGSGKNFEVLNKDILEYSINLIVEETKANISKILQENEINFISGIEKSIVSLETEKNNNLDIFLDQELIYYEENEVELGIDFQTLKATITVLLQNLKTAFTTIVNGLKNAIINLWNTFKEKISKIVDQTLAGIKKISDSIEKGLETFNNAIKEIQNFNPEDLKNNIKDKLTNNRYYNFFKRLKGQSSVSPYIQVNVPDIKGKIKQNLENLSNTPDKEIIEKKLKSIISEKKSLSLPSPEKISEDFKKNLSELSDKIGNIEPSNLSFKIPSLKNNPLKPKGESKNIEENKPSSDKNIYLETQVSTDKGGNTTIKSCTPGNVTKTEIHPSGTYDSIIDDGTKTEKIVADKIIIIDKDWKISVGDNHLMIVSGDSDIIIEKNFSKTVSGNFDTYVEKEKNANVEGNVNDTFNSNFKRIVKGDTTTVTEGNENCDVYGNKTDTISQDLNQTVYGNLLIKVSGDVTIISSGNTNIVSSGETDVSGSNVNINGSGKVSIQAPLISLG